MMLSQYKYAVGTFPNRISAEHALKVLTSCGVQTDQISILVIDAEHDEQFGEVGIGACGWYKAQDGTATCATELIYQHTQPKRHQLPAFMTKHVMMERMHIWKEMTGVSVSI